MLYDISELVGNEYFLMENSSAKESSKSIKRDENNSIVYNNTVTEIDYSVVNNTVTNLNIR